jgi:hypothetical protein
MWCSFFLFFSFWILLLNWFLFLISLFISI